MSWLNQPVSTQGLFMERIKMFSLGKLYQPTNPNPLALQYHLKSGQLFDL